MNIGIVGAHRPIGWTPIPEAFRNPEAVPRFRRLMQIFATLQVESV